MSIDLAALFSPAAAPASHAHSLEILEARIAPAALSVVSVVRSAPTADTSDTSVNYTVTFNDPVTGVDSTDFVVHTEQNAHANPLVAVTPVSSSVYTVTVDGLHGQGDVRLDLVDNDSIVSAQSGPLGGPGVSNGSFQGSAYHLLQTFPKVSSITRVGASPTSANSISWTVTLSAPVTGVDPSDFTLVKSGVTTDAAVTVTGSGTTYTVTATGVSGAGTVALHLQDDGTIKDGNGNSLQGSSLSFAAQPAPSTAASPRTVATGDLNGDGLLDLVTASQGSNNSVSVLLGNGDGTFKTQTSYPTGADPRFVVIADVNGDGKPDLVTANGGTSNASVLLGDGSGGFSKPASIPLPSPAISLAVADLNGDGKPDLVTANVNSNNVSVLLGNGSGGFTSNSTASTGANPVSLTVADVNHDGNLDVITANVNGDTLSVLLGNGKGNLAGQAFAAGAQPNGVAVADVNGDGHPDLIASNFGGGVTLLLGDSSGGFTAQPTIATGGAPYSVAVADVNGDGQLDILTANFGSNDTTVLLGDGSGAFASHPGFPSGSKSTFVAASDVNGDGKADLVVASFGDNTVNVLLGAGTGSFTGTAVSVVPPPTVQLIAHTGPATVTGSTASWAVAFSGPVTGVDAGDFTVLTSGGVKTGAVSVSGSGSSYTVTVSGLHGSGDVHLSLVDNDSIVNSLAPLGGSGVSNGSFQGDAIHVAQTFPKVTSITANGPTTTAGASSASWTVTLSAPVTGVDASDFTLLKGGTTQADGAVSVTGGGATYTVTASGVSGAGSLALQLVDDGTIRDANGNPLQAVQPAFATPTSVTTGNRPYSVTVADINGDGWPDLLTANQGSSTVSVLLGDGHGSFVAQAVVPTGGTPRAVAVADLNGDGKLDLLTTTGNGMLSVRLGNGSGGFSAPGTFALGGGTPTALAVGDVNGDGKTDALVTDTIDKAVKVLLGDGRGGFVLQPKIALGDLAYSIGLADLNADGKLDLAVPLFLGNSVRVLLGDGTGAFTAQPDFAVGEGPDAVAVGDVNADGHPDLVVGSDPGKTVSVLLGKAGGGFDAQPEITLAGNAFALSLGDLNGDGKLDAAVAMFNAGAVAVLVGDGTGTLVKTSVESVTAEPTAVVLGDFNGDGKPDIVTGYQLSASVSVLLATGVGSFTGDSFNVTPPPPPAISIADASVLEGNAGMKTLDFTVTLSHASAQAVSVLYSTVNGTALAPGDYTAVPPTLLTFAPGVTSQRIHVPIFGDTLFEGGADETFQVKLSAPSQATLANSLAIGTILNDDVAPAHSATLDAKHPFTFLDANHDKVTVKLTGAGSGTVTLDGGVAGGADISEIALQATNATSALSVTVVKDAKLGDGLVNIGEVTVDGYLGSFTAKSSDLTTGGFHAAAAVKTIAVRNLLHGEIVTPGNPADKLALSLGTLGAGTLIQTGESISALTAVKLDAASVFAPALGALSVTAGSLAAEITSVGAIGNITVKGGGISGSLNAASFGAVAITGGSFSGSLTSSTAVATLGKTNALSSLSVTTGALSGSVNLVGAAGAITVKGGGLSGELTAASFGAVSVTGGDFSGSVTSLTSAATLGHTNALTSLTVTDGNLTGDVRLRGASGAITVTSKPTAAAGNLTGASIVASAIASLTVAHNFISSIVLAGADLGADHAFGGADDLFAAGAIGAVKIGGSVSGIGSIIGAGFSTGDAILKDGDDAIIGGVASAIASLTITGSAAPESYFAAGVFKTAPRIGGAIVTPAGDGRFRVG